MGGPASEALRGDGAKRKSVRESCRSAGDPAPSALEGAAAAALESNLLAGSSFGKQLPEGSIIGKRLPEGSTFGKQLPEGSTIGKQLPAGVIGRIA